VTERKTTVGDYLAALNFTTLDHAVVTNVTPTSPIPQKWRDVYNRSIQGNQQILEFMRPNGDVVILLIQPNEGTQKPGRRGYGLSDEEPGSPVGNVPYDPSGVNSLEIICPPGPYPRTFEEALVAIGHLPHPTIDNPFSEEASNTPSSNLRSTKPLQLLTDPVALKSQVQQFAPFSQVAKYTLPGAELNEMTPPHDTLKDARAGGKPREEPIKVIERSLENVSYHMRRQKEAEAWEKDVMQRYEGSTDVLSLIDEALSKIRGYEVSMKELKDRAVAERTLHSDGEMHLATVPHHTTPEQTPSPEQTPKPVEVEEVRDEAGEK